LRLCPASSPPLAVVPALVFSGARRPPARVVSHPRASSSPRASLPSRVVLLPHRGRRQRQPKRNTSDVTGGGDNARGGGSVHGHDARLGTIRGATRAGRRREAQPHTECAPPIGHRPARVWTANQKVRNKKPEESPFHFLPNLQDLESIIGGFSTFRRDSRGSKIPIQFMALGWGT
jgi:hypothetical protein